MDWTEDKICLAILQVLKAARKRNPVDGRSSFDEINQIIGVEYKRITAAASRLQEFEALVKVDQNCVITAAGVDYLDELLLKQNPPIALRNKENFSFFPPKKIDPDDFDGVRASRR